MKELNICIRKVKHGQFKDSIDIVILDYFDDIYNTKLESFGNVGSIGSGFCHSSGDFSYFRDSTKNVSINECKEAKKALNEFKKMYESHKIIIKSRLTDKIAKNEVKNEKK